MKILVTGGSGQLGSELNQLSKDHPGFFFFTDKDNLDITNRTSLSAFFQKNRFDYCINCAAYTAVDKAEEEQNLAEAINVNGVRYVADACKDTNTTLIHLSSDYVYHNEVNRPMIEIDPTTPEGIYAQTKLNGEFAALTHSETIVIRTSWLYSSFEKNFVKTMLRLGTERDDLSVVFDQIGTPTYATDLAQTLLQIISQCEAGDPHYGVFNFSNEGVTSWYDFALEIFRMKGIECNVKPITSKQYKTPAKRPTYSVLDKSKIKQKYNVSIPHWRDSLEKCLNLL
ncbi:MAG: dTDP-4-dehydrorhamnose reductase [Maribacter sp.]|jgi:dTDP-4-dehydrorhamnose reductase